MKFIILSCLACLILASCTARDKLYRHHQDDYCDENLIYLPDQGNGRKHERKLSPLALASDGGKNGPTPAHCYFQQHAGATEPATRAHQVGKAENPAHRFNLAFVELGEDGRLLQADQLERLRKSLQDNHDAGKRNHVIMFVHGWRHDAELDNANVRTFRTLLNYSSSFVRQRDDNAVVTGVYVGWRGRSFAEPTTRTNVSDAIFLLGSIWTFWSRKKVSDQLGESLYSLIVSISKELNRHKPENGLSSDSLMLVGHSFGGNMIASGIKARVIEALDDHTHGSNFSLPFADLVVLINPASEASKTNELQRKIRSKVGLTDFRPPPDSQDATSITNAFETLFPISQNPVYISLTSTSRWSNSERKGKPRPKYDWATGFAFPIGQFLAGRTGDDRQAIGHHLPNYEFRQPEEYEVRNNLAQLGIYGPRLGASHDMITDRGLGQRTSFGNAENPDTSACPVIDPWLSIARSRKRAPQDPDIQPNEFGRSWDTQASSSLLTWKAGDRNIEVQLRHQLSVEPSVGDRARAAMHGITTFDSTAQS